MRRMLFVAMIGALVLSQPAAAWVLVQVGPHERSLEVRYDGGACEREAVHNVQTRRGVAISVSSEPLGGGGVCPLILFINRVIIRLSRPLAGRHVQGGQRTSVSEGPRVGPENGTRFPAVPRLTGLAPPDARFLLGGLRLHAVIRVVGGTRGLPRVVSQSPIAGARDPKSRIVRIDVLK